MEIELIWLDNILPMDRLDFFSPGYRGHCIFPGDNICVLKQLMICL